MKLLILGGTMFLGPHVVEYARRRDHVITLFNRGRTNPHLFTDLERLVGDRNGNLAALAGRQWDACIDTSGYAPRMVTESATLLAKNGLRHYLFVSSVSVYPDSAFHKIGVDEQTPVATLKDPTNETVTAESYGPLKAACEAAANRAMPGRVTIVRPGLIVGPRDPTDRFTYWTARLDRGGDVLAPSPRDAPVQFIDARDLARWLVQLVEDGHAGTFNALGPEYELTMEELLHGCKCVAGRPARFTWVDERFLLDQGVGPWMELPLWVPQAEGIGFARVSNARGREKGLTFRPPAETIRDTLDWHRTRPADYRWRGTLKAEKEAAVLQAWRTAATQPATRPTR